MGQLTSCALVEAAGTEVTHVPAVEPPSVYAPMSPTSQQNPLPKFPFHRDQAGSAHVGPPSILPMQFDAASVDQSGNETDA